MANLFWLHPDGDDQIIPCVHIVPKHPQGDEVTVPCTHALVQQHPDGDSVEVTVLGKR